MADFRARLGEWQSELKGFTLTASSAHRPGKADIDAALARTAKQLDIRDSFAFIEALLAAKDDWLDAADDIHDLVNFYKTQITAWRKLLDGLRTFAATARRWTRFPGRCGTGRTRQIRDNPKPFAQVNRVEPLLATVAAVNEELTQARREKPCCPLMASWQRCGQLPCRRRYPRPQQQSPAPPARPESPRRQPDKALPDSVAAR